MTPDMSRRIGAAMTRGRATVEERQTLIAAAAANSVEAMPAEAQRILRDLETRTPPLPWNGS